MGQTSRPVAENIPGAIPVTTLKPAWPAQAPPNATS